MLEQADVAQAASLILSASGSAANLDAVRIARELNPHIHIVARADFLSEVEPLTRAGADEVFTGEGEVALTIVDSVLRKLGATPDQLDESRERVRLKMITAHS